ncbi:growth-regulated alpha protein-like [Sorex araneus]|uniref:growth-regulated alpha protein-like n=1 Tax=Sorex araneus TaxID=42254 RepID=UPI002433F365|nr:growth-regulated alpha protein-like [Sorex araneus]
MARAATPATPRALGTLRAALLLLLLGAACRRVAGVPLAYELRCQCLETIQGVHFKNIQSVTVTPPAPHCPRTEVVATLKNGHQACLNPEAPLVKKIVEKMLTDKSIHRHNIASGLHVHIRLSTFKLIQNLKLSPKTWDLAVTLHWHTDEFYQLLAL